MAGFPWTAVALAGTSILEAILGGLNKPKGQKKFTEEAITTGRGLLRSPGYSQDVINAIFGKDFGNIRAGQEATSNQITEMYGRQGMVGTGSEMKAQKENMWANQRLVAEAMRDLLIASEGKKQSDIALAGQLLGVTTGASQAAAGGAPPLTELLVTGLTMDAQKKSMQQWQDYLDILKQSSTSGWQQGAAAGALFPVMPFGAPIPSNPSAIWNS